MPRDLSKPHEKCYSPEHSGGEIGPILLSPAPAPWTIEEEEVTSDLPGVNGPILRLAITIAVRALEKQGMTDPTKDEVLDLLREGWTDWLPALRRKVIQRGEFEL